ncbi:NDR1/HIN1-like protein 13 [Quercus lobata]|uniref:Late embryogenesis abundant protein LEA-2 subgroup domain-containing protein n=1 Tax=Quercus lobata TaxID=97700 RepID=A0A7N2N7I0_QUELO|nr:NDR1/HIN1-like protein 13 [Quercus lobata]
MLHQERDTDPDQQPETNPYFRPLSLDQRSQRPPSQDQRSQRPPSHDQRSQPPFAQGQPPNQWPQPPSKKGKKSKQGGQEQRQPSRPRQQDQQSPGSADHFPLNAALPSSQSKPNQQRLKSQDPSSPPPVPSTLPSGQRTQNEQAPPHGSSSPPNWRQHPQRQGQYQSGLTILPREHHHRHKPLTWFLAVFCAILWVVIIVGGLIVLIVYLVYRPRLPRFDISAATLNAAYLDMGYLLNADVTMLANFSNPNRKVNVDFSYMYIDLYYGSTLIATQYVPPFYATRAQSKFAYIHMVTSQVGIPLVAARRLKKQIEAEGVQFQVKGYFRARSTLGRLLKYSYLLHTHCYILMSGPPTGALIRSECRTKR